MNTTFDRYLLVRYLQIFAILFVSMFGLFVVIDGFSNVDEFQENLPDNGHGASTWAMLTRMGWYYSYQSTIFIDMCGPILTVVTAMVVFALLQRNSELQPILAAGVPAWRLMYPVIAGTVAVNGLLVANQELVIPRIADVLQTPRDALLKGTIAVEPLTDRSSGIYIDGHELSLHPQQIKDASFILPAGRIARLTTTIRASQAVYVPAKKNHAAGWLLKNADKPYDRIPLTEEGTKFVRRLENTENQRDVFVISELSFDQLHDRLQSSKLLSTPELIRRLRSPTFGQRSSPALAQHLHARLVRPFANLFAVLLSVPLILRKESRGLVTNMAISAAVLVLVLGVSEAVAYCGKAGMLSPELSAWIPIFGTGTLFAWLTGIMQT